MNRRNFFGLLPALAAVPFLVPKQPDREEAQPEIEVGVVEAPQQVHICIDGINPHDPRHQQLIRETLQETRQRFGLLP